MRLVIGLTMVLIVALVCGCSTGGSAPTASGLSPRSVSDIGASSHVVQWGTYRVSIDTRTWAAEVEPLRGADYVVDVVTFLQPPAGKMSNLKLQIVDASNWASEGRIDLNVMLTHPFPGMNEYTGHDVIGVLMSPGLLNGVYDTTVAYIDGVEGCKLLNADGYTRWMNPVEFPSDGKIFRFTPGALGSKDIGAFNATINGYKYFSDSLPADQTVNDYYSDPAHVHNRGQFRAGSANTRAYHLQFPYKSGPVLTFQYAVVAHWVPPTDLNPSDIPGSFPPSANADEVIFARVVNIGSTLWYSPTAGTGGGDLTVGLEVFDQGGPHNPLGVPGEIGKIVVESKDQIFAGGLVSFMGDDLAATATAGSGGNSSVVTLEFKDCVLQGLDFANPLLITVESKSPTTFDPGNGVSPTSSALASYFFFDGMNEVKVNNELPSEPADPIEGNVALKVLRNGNYAITGLELDWTGNGNPEYAVYADLNPYDGLMPDTFIAATSAETINIDTTNYPAFSTNAAYAFTVRARSVAGDDSSESTDSQLAFVEMEDFDGGADPSGGWTRYYLNSSSQLDIVPGPIDGNALRMPPCPNYQWAAAISPQLPQIPDNEYSVLETAQRTESFGSNTWPECLAGMYANSTFGWADAPGVNGNPDYKSLHGPLLDAAIDGTWPVEDQLNPDCSLVSISVYFGPDSEGYYHGWRIFFLDNSGDPPPIRFSRLSVAELRTQPVAYAAMGFGDANTYPDSIGLVHDYYCDELAVVIY